MRVTRFNPLWVSGTTQTYSEEYYGQWTCSPAFQVTVYLSSFSIYPFVTTVVVSKGTETNKFFGFPALSLCNLNAFNTRRFRDLYNGSSNGPFIERYIKDISLMATKSEEILTKEFKSRNIGLFYRFQTADKRWVWKASWAIQLLKCCFEASLAVPFMLFKWYTMYREKLHLSHKFSVWAVLHF